MEINAEINRVFGQEMAQLFASQISEEELLATARQVWFDMQRDDGSSWNRVNSPAKRAIQEQLQKRLVEEVGIIASTPEFQKECHELAEKMIEEIKEETHRKMVEEVSNRLCGASVGYQGLGLKSMIEQTIMECMHR